MSGYGKKMHRMTACAVACLLFSGCSTPSRVVRQGDKVALSFDCRLQGGELAATTRLEAELAGEKKSSLYLPRTGPATVSVAAGGEPSEAQGKDRLPFEQEILQRLAPTVVGLKEGDEVRRLLEAERFPASSPKERTVRLAKVRSRVKELRIPLSEYTGKTGKTPQVGDRYQTDRMVPGQVSEVTGKEVVVRFAPAPGDLTTPFGKVDVRELPDRYELEINPQKGALVRTGALAGRISELDADGFTVDYGHPFAGEKLACDLKVVSVEPAAATAGTAPANEPQTRVQGIPVAGEPDPKMVREFDEALRRMSEGAQTDKDHTPSGQVAAAGDLATVAYTVRLEDGTVFYRSAGTVAQDPAGKKPAGEPVPVGGRALIPGVGEALGGMAVGAKKSLVLPPEKGFGPSDPAKVLRLPLVRTIPRKLTFSAEEYLKRFGSFPVAGSQVQLTPYFPARVAAVREREVDLELLAQDDKSFSEPFGTTSVRLSGDSIVTTLKPVVGGSFPVPGGSGTITASDATTFTLDLNHPLAGKTVTIDLELASLTKASDLPAGELPWQEDHDAALAQAKGEGKPAVLVLYADWCGFCKRLFGETMPDARIRALRDSFSWIKADSDKRAELQKLYGQNGFPMIVLFNPDGSVKRKLDGFQEASSLRAALQEVL